MFDEFHPTILEAPIGRDSGSHALLFQQRYACPAYICKRLAASEIQVRVEPYGLFLSVAGLIPVVLVCYICEPSSSVQTAEHQVSDKSQDVVSSCIRVDRSIADQAVPMLIHVQWGGLPAIKQVLDLVKVKLSACLEYGRLFRDTIQKSQIERRKVDSDLEALVDEPSKRFDRNGKSGTASHLFGAA